MDKYEFNIKVEQIKKLVNKGDYETAMKIADTIDWRRVRSTSLLTTIAQVYERNAEYQDAKDILLLAFERAPIGKGLLFKLTDLALREGNVPEAEAYYREFCDLAVDDPRQNLLRFLILEAKGATIEQLIHSLEKYCQEELDEKWMYHLAELYQQAGMETQCVNMCDRIMLMFGLGKYVDKAMELKLQFAPLTKYQMDLVENREKYEEKLRAVEEKYNSRTLRREPEEEDEYFDSEDAEEADMNGLDMDERMDAHDENRHRAASRNMDSEDDGMYPEEEQMYPEESDFLEDDLVSSLHEAKAEEELAKKNEADILVGNNKKKDIAQILEEYFAAKEPEQEVPVVSEVIDINHTKEYEDLTIHKVNEHTRAYIKIQDGCNQFCSYCIIPYTRGRIRSKNPEEVIEEVKNLAAQGYKEIVLTGIHLSSYGKDLGTVTLLDVIKRIQQVEDVERIRLGSLEPRIITEEFVKELVKCDKVCPHFHLSLQSGCDETLKRMNRKYTTEEYEEALNILRKYYEHPALTTDVIAGFVGETEEEFEKTRAYLEKINLYEMHIFKYSVREGTRAQKMSGHVPEQVKTERSEVLLSMAKRHKTAFEEWYVGRKEKVLLEEIVEKNGKKYFQGYTAHYVKVAVELTENDTKLEQNEVIVVDIQGFIDENLLYGKVSIEF